MKRLLRWFRDWRTKTLKVPRWVSIGWDLGREPSQTIVTLSREQWDEQKLRIYSLEIALRRCDRTLVEAANLGTAVHQDQKRRGEGKGGLSTQAAMMAVHANQAVLGLRAILPPVPGRERVEA